MGIIYMPQNPMQQALPLLLSNMILQGNAQRNTEKQMERQYEMRQKDYAQRVEVELQEKGFTPFAAEPGDATARPDVEILGKGYMRPKPLFSPLSIEGKTVPGKYLFTHGGNNPQVVTFPRQFTKFDTKEISLGPGKTMVIGYPVDDTGTPAFDAAKIISTPKETTPSDLLASLKVTALMGLSRDDRAKALFSGLREKSPKAMRELDIAARAAGVDLAKLEDGTLTTEEAQAIVSKQAEMRLSAMDSLMMRGLISSGAPQGGQRPAAGEQRERELLKKKSRGPLTSSEEAELRALSGGR